MNIVNKDFLFKNFPPIKYAFISNYIIRSSRFRNIKVKEKPLVDTILVCEDIDIWHKENYKMNKNHYPLISKFTSYKLVTYFQRKGAKIHFNYFNNQEGDLLRYGVVSWQDFINDLDNWKTLTVSTYMHKPFDTVVENPEVENHQVINLVSALCLASLFSIDEGKSEFIVSENEFYDKIIKIPLIQGSYFKIFDDKDIIFDVKEIISEFRKLYLPVIDYLKKKPSWDDFIRFDEKSLKFTIKNNIKAKKFFLDNINLQIYREISGLSRGIYNF